MISLVVKHSDHIQKKEVKNEEKQQKAINKQQVTNINTDDPHCSNLQSSINTPKKSQSSFNGSKQQSQQSVDANYQHLLNICRTQAQKIVLNRGYDPIKQAQIAKYLHKLHMQKRQRQSILKKQRAKLQAKLSQPQIGNEEQKKRKREEIQANLNRMQIAHKKRLEEQQTFLQFYAKYKQSTPVYKVLEEEFNNKTKEERKEKQRQRLSQIKQLHKPIDQDELSSFAQLYQQRKQQKQRQRVQTIQMIQKAQHQARSRLSHLYKGQYYFQPSNPIDHKSNARQKQQRTKQYGESVREQLHQTINSMIPQEEEKEKPNKTIVKERYLNGYYQGKKEVKEYTPLSTHEQNLKGLSYLEEVKRIPKKKKIEVIEEEPVRVNKPRVYSVERNSNALYRSKKKGLNVQQMQDRESLNGVIDQLKVQQEKISLDQLVFKHNRYDSAREKQLKGREITNKMVDLLQLKLQLLKSL